MWQEALSEVKQMSREHSAKKLWEPYKVSILLNLGRYDEAANLAESSASCQNSPVRAVALAYIGREERAIRLAKESVSSRRDRAELALGKVCEISGRLEEALLHYERAAGRFQMRSDGMRNAARMLMKLEDYSEALVAWQQAIRLAKLVRVEDLEQLATCFRKLGNEAAAIEAEDLATEYRERDRKKSEDLAQLAAAE